jgi:hypothetical protein
MDSIDHYVMEAETKRDAALTVFDNFIGYLKQIHGEIVRIAAEKDATERLAGTERARLKNEIDGGRKELNELNLEIREARKVLEQTIKENARHKQEIRKIMDDIFRKKAVA